MMETVRQDRIAIQPECPEPGQGSRDRPVEEDDFGRRQPAFDFELHSQYPLLEGCALGVDCLDVSTCCDLLLHILSCPFGNGPIPLGGQQIDQGSLATRGSPGDDMPVRLNVERSRK